MTLDWRQPSAFVGLIGWRWTLTVLAELAAGGRRYQDLHDGLGGISHKVLTETTRCERLSALGPTESRVDRTPTDP